MNFDSSDIPNALLLRGSCISCHGQNPGGSSNIISFGNVPQVLHSATTDLAGGNFKYLDTDDSKGHNVITGNQEGNGSMFPPPGNEFTENNTINSTNFTCAGALGCHGNRTISGGLNAIKGAHHYNDKDLKFNGPINEGNQAKTSGTNGEQVGSSYRFLKGVKGGEDTDWQATSSASDHNEYKGATTGGVSEDVTATFPGSAGSISGLCAECHGNFHGGSADIGGPTGTPWLRHPTDISLPSSGEYIAYTTYSLTAPVARTTIPSSPSATVTPLNATDDIIMCLSCHRAHASNYFKLMRWDYKGWPAGGTNGCAVCHTSKN